MELMYWHEDHQSRDCAKMLAQTLPIARSTRTSSGLKDRLPYSCSPMAIQEKKKKKNHCDRGSTAEFLLLKRQKEKKRKDRSQDSKQEIHLKSLARSDATV